MKDKNIVVRCFSMISQFSIHMLVPICMCSYAGYWLDKKLQTSFLFIFLFFIGAMAGGRNVYQLAQKLSGAKDHMPSELYGSNRKKKKREVNSGNEK